MKERTYSKLMEMLARNCGLGKYLRSSVTVSSSDIFGLTGPGDLIVTMMENSKEDWSFGAGRAQFLTGEL